MPFSLNKKFRSSNTGDGHGKAGTVIPEYVYVIPGSPYATCWRGSGYTLPNTLKWIIFLFSFYKTSNI